MKIVKLAAAMLCLTAPAFADTFHSHGHGHGHGHSHSGNEPLRADGHAPISVMGDHRHATGEIMLSYRFMRMDMGGNQVGSSNVSPEFIATNVANRFGAPPTLRVVPTQMTMDMHMFGAMYAPNDRVTLMAMLPYITKEMDHITFQGMAGTNRLGGFRTKSEGFGDVKVSALIGLWEGGSNSLHANIGVSLPTGSTSERDNILTPMNTRPNVRLPYSMQIGSGTYDLLPGITYLGRSGNIGYGAQVTGVIRMGSNNGYSLGNEVKANVWGSVQPAPWVSLSGRLEWHNVGKISGIDPQIAGPVQTADPNNYGGDFVTAYLGVNTVVQNGALRGHRFALEAGMPVYQNLNGPQMERDWTLTLGWQKAF
ncbi:MAG: transporter [Pseudomonadota bacterium]